jgi:hypothetical protein
MSVDVAGDGTLRLENRSRAVVWPPNILWAPAGVPHTKGPCDVVEIQVGPGLNPDGSTHITVKSYTEQQPLQGKDHG